MAIEIKKVLYEDGAGLDQEDFREEQAYLMHQRRHLAAQFMTAGILQGLAVSKDETIPADPALIIEKGYALSIIQEDGRDAAREIILQEEERISLASLDADSQMLYLVVTAGENLDMINHRVTERPEFQTVAELPDDLDKALVLATFSLSGGPASITLNETPAERKLVSSKMDASKIPVDITSELTVFLKEELDRLGQADSGLHKRGLDQKYIPPLILTAGKVEQDVSDLLQLNLSPTKVLLTLENSSETSVLDLPETKIDLTSAGLSEGTVYNVRVGFKTDAPDGYLIQVDESAALPEEAVLEYFTVDAEGRFTFLGGKGEYRTAPHYTEGVLETFNMLVDFEARAGDVVSLDGQKLVTYGDATGFSLDQRHTNLPVKPGSMSNFELSTDELVFAYKQEVTEDVYQDFFTIYDAEGILLIDRKPTGRDFQTPKFIPLNNGNFMVAEIPEGSASTIQFNVFDSNGDPLTGPEYTDVLIHANDIEKATVLKLKNDNILFLYEIKPSGLDSEIRFCLYGPDASQKIVDDAVIIAGEMETFRMLEMADDSLAFLQTRTVIEDHFLDLMIYNADGVVQLPQTNIHSGLKKADALTVLNWLEDRITLTWLEADGTSGDQTSIGDSLSGEGRLVVYRYDGGASLTKLEALDIRKERITGPMLSAITEDDKLAIAYSYRDDAEIQHMNFNMYDGEGGALVESLKLESESGLGDKSLSLSLLGQPVSIPMSLNVPVMPLRLTPLKGNSLACSYITMKETGGNLVLDGKVFVYDPANGIRKIENPWLKIEGLITALLYFLLVMLVFMGQGGDQLLGFGDVGIFSHLIAILPLDDGKLLYSVNVIDTSVSNPDKPQLSFIPKPQLSFLDPERDLLYTDETIGESEGISVLLGGGILELRNGAFIVPYLNADVESLNTQPENAAVYGALYDRDGELLETITLIKLEAETASTEFPDISGEFLKSLHNGDLMFAYYQGGTTGGSSTDDKKFAYQYLRRFGGKVLGLSLQDGADEEPVNVLLSGLYRGYTDLIPGKKYYTSTGNLSRDNRGEYVGIALAEDMLLVEPGV